MLDENKSVHPVASTHHTWEPQDAGTKGLVREPLAIIGIGCHFPGGATSPQAFWELLCAGTDATREVPEDRWDVRKFYDPDLQKSGKMNTFRGGYLERLDQFDAHFFGISPREAIWLDPQQRLLLQTTWEALEDAGQVTERLAGSDTGVFIGGFTLDYQLMQNFGVFSRYELQTHSATGMMMTMLANRISYVFGFHGPSMAVDTACSGSLVAVHLACQSIWNGECSMAIAGGANAMIAPTMTIAESKGGFLSPDGRCKTFDASANGYARGEGAGVVLIKPLARAQADGDPIYALIRGTAVTQDGHSNGITVPNQLAQEAAMRMAYQRAGILPAQVQYVEAHGTGTPVGDPLEASAIGKVLSTGRPANEQCIVGSVKTNIGHLEAAAGIAGLVKTALALKYRQIPPHLHFRDPNPDIPFDMLQLHVPTTLEAWPETPGPAMAGVNSFGFGGTNAHVVLQEAPPSVQATSTLPSEVERPSLLPLSARSTEALLALARSYRDFLADDAPSSASLHDIVYSASLRRSHHDHRLALVTHSKAEAVAHLEAFLADDTRSGIFTGHIPLHNQLKTVFVCSGMGPQWWAMGRDLLEHEPVFRAMIERCDAEFQRYTDWSLLAQFTAAEATSRMEEVAVAEPANFALQVALAELWRSWGIEPDAIIGHSTGEFAAHYLAGSLSFEDAVRVVYHHSCLHQQTSGSGRMLAIGMSYETLNRAELDVDNRVSIAAINGPTAVTLSGDADVLADIAQQLETFEVFYRFLDVNVPYHSHCVEPLREALLTSLADLHPQSASLPLYSTVTGTRIDGRGVDAHYWWQNTRATVLFSSALNQMIQDGYSVFLELSPHPVLTSSITELLAQQEQVGTVLPSLRRREEDRAIMLGSLGVLYTLGYPIAWQTLSKYSGNFVNLPAYPWQFKSYWTESIESREDRLLTSVHPLLGQRMNAAHPTWELELNPRLLPYLSDHRIQENVLVPGAAFIEMILAAAREVFGEGAYAVEELAFRKALFLPDVSDPRLQTVLNPQHATVEIYSYNPTASGAARWTLHTTARLRQIDSIASPTRFDLDSINRAYTTHISKEEFYQQSQHMGFQYGPAFQAIEHVETGESIALGYLHVPASVGEDLTAYTFHPALLDAAFQVLITAIGPTEATPEHIPTPYLPVSVDCIRIVGRPAQQMQAYAQLIKADERLVVGNVQMVDPEGNLLVEIKGFHAQSLEASLSLTPERIDKGLYELEWQPRARSDEAEDLSVRVVAQDGSWLIFIDQSGVGEALLKHLEQQGERYVTVSYTDAPQLVQRGEHYALNPANLAHFQQLFTALTAQGPFSRVVHLWSLDSAFTETSPLTALEQAQTTGSLAIVYLTQTLSQSGWPHLPYIWLVTRGAQAVGTMPSSIAVEQAPVWGLGRVIGHQEFTSMWGGLVDLDTGPVAEQASLLFEEIWHADDEDQVAFRSGQRYVARLVPSTHLTPPLPPTFRPDGSYLITGGLGSLGMLVARWMITQGARRLILMGRTKVPPRSTWHQLEADHPQRGLLRAIQELETLGATVHLAEVDVADEAQLATFLKAYKCEGWPPIKGVIHTAGVVQDELLLRMTTETFLRVLRPKMRGGWLLHHLLKDAPLDFFLLFSSTGSVIASLGQGNYAAGNAFLDALAHHRRALGLPALSIGWGPWSVGMVEQLKLEEFYTKRGIELITPDVGMQILGRVLGQRPIHLTAISANWSIARDTSPVGMLPSMFSLLKEQTDEPATNETNNNDEALLLQLGAVQVSERQSLLTTHLQELVARVLQLDSAQFNSHESLTSMGLDSMMAIEVKHRIKGSLKVDISVLELLQDITIVRLATRVLSSLELDEGPIHADTEPSMAEIQQLIEQADSEDLEHLLAELEGTSDSEDIEQLLAELELTLDSEANV